MIQTITCSGKRFYCEHTRGWYKTVRIKKWWFEVTGNYFLCLDCEDLIPIDEHETVQRMSKDSNLESSKTKKKHS